ncbi:VOC family protein [Microbacterium aerolatum]|uniref:Lactoylglutathione lyase n=1 Tax=Microbacterium aerolatum TaxID=153731 RepID=A0A511AG69_9MICO|nr:VOC family protein [Microbacterium aerolatum]GEK85681.1 lactoylglutathione lyase [Microbacterium aerolatum]GGB21225.1 lactoylglutathione lyase [Microbacterium aerolatum]
MNNAELVEHNKNRKIYQIAVVTRDIYRTMDAWIENLKIGPWTVLTFTNETMDYLRVGGEEVTEPYKFLIAISRVGDMEFEIIQPVYGPTIYDAFLNAKGEGLHHIKEQVSDEKLPGVLSEYASKGIEVMQTGQFDIDVHYYLDSAHKVDFIYELGNCPVYDLPADMYTIYPDPGN